MHSMSPFARLGLAFLALAGCASANNKLTSTPANFRGFYILDNGAVSTVTCSGESTFYTSSTYGACCTADNCNFATACNSGTASRIFGGTYTCDTAFPDCYTITIYASYPSADQSWLIRGCATNWRASTLYREIVTSTSASSATKTSPSQADTATLSGPTETAPGGGGGGGGAGGDEDGSGLITAPPASTPTQSNGAAAAAATSGGSQAWIAGAVIGPLVGIALIGALGYWLGRRRLAGGSAVSPTNNEAPEKSADHSSLHPSMYYAASSPLTAGVSPGSYAPHEAHSMATSTPSPVNGYMNPVQGMYQQQGAYGAPYPPQQQYSPQPYPAQFHSPTPPMERFPSPHNAAELASGPLTKEPQELGDGVPKMR